MQLKTQMLSVHNFALASETVVKNFGWKWLFAKHDKVLYEYARPFDTVWLPLNCSGNPGVKDDFDREGCELGTRPGWLRCFGPRGVRSDGAHGVRGAQKGPHGGLG